jgi:hypothetical protein
VTRIDGEVVVERPVEEVIDLVADPRDEPLYNPDMARVELLTPALDTHGTLSFEPVAGGTRMRWNRELEPRGTYRLLGPLIAILGNRMERRIWAEMKRHLEDRGL